MMVQAISTANCSHLWSWALMETGEWSSKLRRGLALLKDLLLPLFQMSLCDLKINSSG